MIATMCIPYIPMLFAPLEHLLTDSMTPMLDVKLDHRHCSSPKCPTICRLVRSYIVLRCCLVYDNRSLIMCLRLHLRVTSYMSEL